MRRVDADEFFEKIKTNDLSYMQQADVMRCIKDMLDRQPTVGPAVEKRKFLIIKPDGSTETLFLADDQYGKWTFVDLTNGHICGNKFDFIKQAVDFLDGLKKSNIIQGYYNINE